ncbi:MAG: hypothetical protein NTU53_03875 [Planctomycetota bacterium]|nr:hypothetical protein [Planctomycetota bacterium]
MHEVILRVTGLRKGKSQARESAPVKPIPEAWVARVIRYVSRQVMAMIELQLLTGMRPGEAVLMRHCDFEAEGGVKPAKLLRVVVWGRSAVAGKLAGVLESQLRLGRLAGLDLNMQNDSRPECHFLNP